MTKDEFRDAVWTGLGRAIIWARDHDVREFRDVILDAWLHCRAIDPQCEGTRALFMWELVNLLPDAQFYREELIPALAICGDDFDAVLRFRLASYFAIDGDEEIRRVMYAAFNPGPRMAEESGIDFLQLDGLAGFLFAAEKVGALLLAGPEEVDTGHMFFVGGEKFGEEKTLAALGEAGKSNAHIEAYRLKMLAGKQEDARSVRSEPSQLKYSEFRPKLFDAARMKIAPHRWGSKASGEDLELAAGDLENVITAEVQVRYLRIFARTRFPLHPAPLLELALSSDDQVARAAAMALAQIEHSEVRETAFRLMRTGRVGRESSITMLVRNWRQGDHETVLRWFEIEADPWIRHSFVQDLRDAWKTHPDPESEVGMLLVLYEKGTCSLCREFVVGRLIELDALPDPVRAECAFDSNDEIRALVGAGSVV